MLGWRLGLDWIEIGIRGSGLAIGIRNWGWTGTGLVPGAW